jgi:procollagen-lysine,2-oxoglutarate 5-dioxygenase
VLTCSTDDWKAYRLFDSAEKYGINITNLGKEVEWRGTDMSGPGGGQKLNLLREYIEKVPDTDVIFFVDGYDVFFADDLNSIIDRWLDFNRRALFGAEKYCWPDTSLANQFPPQETEYKYLNSGTFIAEVETLRQILSDPVADSSDDQLYVQQQYLRGELDIAIDAEQYIFQTYDESVSKNAWGQLVNKETNCTGCVFHGNGGPEAKKKLDSLYLQFLFDERSFIAPNIVKNLSNDMLEVSFLSDYGCKALIDIAENHGDWEPLPYDKFPAQEMRLSEL